MHMSNVIGKPSMPICFIFLICFVLPSAVIDPIGLYLSLGLSIFLILLKGFKNPINLSVLLFSLAMLSYIFLVSFYAQDITPIALGVALPISLLLNFLILNDRHNIQLYNGVINYATYFSFFGLGCSIVGFLYAYFHGEPLLCIDNPDGRSNCLYLSTFSNSIYGNVIRPGFIFDEPGTFSFYLTCVAIIRELNNKNAKITFSIILLGMITFSLTHVLILFLFILSKIIKSFISTLSAGVVFCVGIVVFGSIINSEYDDLDFFTNRLSYAGIVDNNRVQQLDSFFNIVDDKIFLVGNVECLDRPERKCTEHGDISSSPVTPVYRLGVFGLLIQLVTHSLLIILTLIRPRLFFCTMSLSILLLQRPYFTSINYSFLIYIVLSMMILFVLKGRDANIIGEEG